MQRTLGSRAASNPESIAYIGARRHRESNMVLSFRYATVCTTVRCQLGRNPSPWMRIERFVDACEDERSIASLVNTLTLTTRRLHRLIFRLFYQDSRQLLSISCGARPPTRLKPTKVNAVSACGTEQPWQAHAAIKLTASSIASKSTEAIRFICHVLHRRCIGFVV